MRYALRPMRVEDVDEVVQIERQSFSLAWPSSAYRREIRDNRMASYVVIERASPTVAPEPEAAMPERQSGSVWQRLRMLFAGETEVKPGTGELIGYAGMWLMVDEAHITTIAVRPEYRGKGFGELLMIGMFERAMEVGARWVTLEVRVSNNVAQNLYRKYTFHAEGLRKGYYSDNNEDAVIMWSEDIRQPEFPEKFRALKTALVKRLAEEGS
ncbi:MAG: ribosomal protein S18-alanine N-acetyltransferase [Chloroflexota bacterium]